MPVDFDIETNKLNCNDMFGRMVTHLLARLATIQSEHVSQKLPFFKRKLSMPYTFIAHNAVDWLKATYNFDKTQAYAKLDEFLDGHYLHSPSNKSLSSVSHGHNELQPTAKGFAVLQDWFEIEAVDLDEHTKAVLHEAFASSYNSMELITLERSILQNKLKLSTGVAIIVWNRLMGHVPHEYEGKASNPYMRSPSPSDSSSVSSKSPYYVRTMLHPNSFNLMQYWSSDGLRLFRNLRFEHPGKSRFVSPVEYTVDYVISGHALLQWIMDCTSVENSREGMKLAKMLVTQGFLKHIVDPPVDALAAVSVEMNASSKDEKAGFSTHDMYRMTPRGSRLCAWEHLIDEGWLDKEDLEMEYTIAAARLNTEKTEFDNTDLWSWEHEALPEIDATFGNLLSFQIIQSEPGLKLLFREEVTKLQCVENFKFVDIVQRFLLLVNTAQDASNSVSRKNILETEIERLLARLCKLYIEVGAPFELNLSEFERNAVLNACNEMAYNDVVQPLLTVKHRCINMLRDALNSFKMSDKTREVPSFRTYIVARYYKPEYNASGNNETQLSLFDSQPQMVLNIH